MPQSALQLFFPSLPPPCLTRSFPSLPQVGTFERTLHQKCGAKHLSLILLCRLRLRMTIACSPCERVACHQCYRIRAFTCSVPWIVSLTRAESRYRANEVPAAPWVGVVHGDTRTSTSWAGPPHISCSCSDSFLLFHTLDALSRRSHLSAVDIGRCRLYCAPWTPLCKLHKTCSSKRHLPHKGNTHTHKPENHLPNENMWRPQGRRRSLCRIG